jgi:hypothetical protein
LVWIHCVEFKDKLKIGQVGMFGKIMGSKIILRTGILFCGCFHDFNEAHTVNTGLIGVFQEEHTCIFDLKPKENIEYFQL